MSATNTAQRPRRVSDVAAGDQRETPEWLVVELARRYAGGEFTLDAAASPENAVADAYYTAESNGLEQLWPGRVFVNCPWSDIEPWVLRAHGEVCEGNAEVVVMVLPARTGTEWFAYALKHAELISFIRGRPQFDRPDGERNSSCPEDVVVVVFRKPILVSELRPKRVRHVRT